MDQTEVIEIKLPEFIEEMKSKLETSTAKYGDFTGDRLQDFLYHFGSEVRELPREFVEGPSNSENIAKEAVDVGNVAFMLWWSTTDKGGR